MPPLKECLGGLQHGRCVFSTPRQERVERDIQAGGANKSAAFEDRGDPAQAKDREPGEHFFVVGAEDHFLPRVAGEGIPAPEFRGIMAETAPLGATCLHCDPTAERNGRWHRGRTCQESSCHPHRMPSAQRHTTSREVRAGTPSPGAGAQRSNYDRARRFCAWRPVLRPVRERSIIHQRPAS